MHHIATIVTFFWGMCAMWNFMRTAYAYPNISRLFYFADGLVALALLAGALWLSNICAARNQL